MLLVTITLLRFLALASSILLVPPMMIPPLLCLNPRPGPTRLLQHRRSPLVLKIMQLPCILPLPSPDRRPVLTCTVEFSTDVPMAVTLPLVIPTVMVPPIRALSAAPVLLVTVPATAGLAMLSLI